LTTRLPDATLPRALVSPLDPYPRNRKSIILGYVGKKVTISTTDFHYAVGTLIELDHDDRVRLSVRDRDVLIARRHVATIQEAHAALAEYVK
jgi:hypothetical protein